jgi:hypothetical protein
MAIHGNSRLIRKEKMTEPINPETIVPAKLSDGEPVITQEQAESFLAAMGDEGDPIDWFEEDVLV